jgi:hypothetical protein
VHRRDRWPAMLAAPGFCLPSYLCPSARERHMARRRWECCLPCLYVLRATQSVAARVGSVLGIDQCGTTPEAVDGST